MADSTLVVVREASRSREGMQMEMEMGGGNEGQRNDSPFREKDGQMRRRRRQRREEKGAKRARP